MFICKFGFKVYRRKTGMTHNFFSGQTTINEKNQNHKSQAWGGGDPDLSC